MSASRVRDLQPTSDRFAGQVEDGVTLEEQGSWTPMPRPRHPGAPGSSDPDPLPPYGHPRHPGVAASNGHLTAIPGGRQRHPGAPGPDDVDPVLPHGRQGHPGNPS